MGRREEIMSMMSLSTAKNPDYPDATPAVHIALEKVQKQCSETAATVAEKVGGDEEALQTMCVRNAIMLNPVLNSSYYIRKEVLQWDSRL
jgi:hypothetical protein